METKSARGGQVLDGSDIVKLVENDKVFTNFVDHKFQELDRDRDGELSVKELEPAVSDIGAALGLPAKGSSPDSDNIYSEVLSEFTHGTKETVSKSEFKEVLSDILMGMAAGLKRDPIVILRIDGEDLMEFISRPSFESEMVSIYFQIEMPNATVRDYIIEALKKLDFHQGMPPAADPWVMSNVVEPVVRSCGGHSLNAPVSQEAFLVEFKKVAEAVARLLKEQPVIVAHSENNFDGSGIKRLMSNKFELDKITGEVLRAVPKDKHGKMSKEYLRVGLDAVASSAGIPPYGAIPEMDKVYNNVFQMVSADDGQLVKEDEFKKLLLEILGSIMLQLEGNSISVSSNSVVHEPLAAASSLLPSASEM